MFGGSGSGIGKVCGGGVDNGNGPDRGRGGRDSGSGVGRDVEDGSVVVG